MISKAATLAVIRAGQNDDKDGVVQLVTQDVFLPPDREMVSLNSDRLAIAGFRCSQRSRR